MSDPRAIKIGEEISYMEPLMLGKQAEATQDTPKTRDGRAQGETDGARADSGTEREIPGPSTPGGKHGGCDFELDYLGENRPIRTLTEDSPGPNRSARRRGTDAAKAREARTRGASPL